MAKYNFNVVNSVNGVCSPKLAREIKLAIGLAKKPAITYSGRNKPGTDNLENGTLEIQCRELNPAEQAILAATFDLHVGCPPFSSADLEEIGTDMEDLEDMLATSIPGQVIYVRDLPRKNGESAGRGTMVYRARNGWRRMSDDTAVNVGVGIT